MYLHKENSNSCQAISLLVSVSLILISFSLLSFSDEKNGIMTKKPIPRKEHNPKLSTELELISLTANTGEISNFNASNRSAGQFGYNENRVTVVIEEKQGSSIKDSSISSMGGRVVGKAKGLKKVQLPVKKVISITERLDGVKFVRLPYKPVLTSGQAQTTRSANSSYFETGLNLTGGSLYHANGFLGEGVKVAIIDLGFASLDLAKSSGELPESSLADKQDYTGSGIRSGTAHGTGVAEIVHDMAPGAELYLKKIGDGVDLAAATEDTISQGIDVIVHSVGWLNTNFGDGKGMIADITRNATDRGVLWVNAAGNSAQRHWEGEYTDRDGDNWMEFQPGDESVAVENELGRDIALYLTWNDWPSSDQDLDLYLYDEDGDLVSSSQNYQTGNEPPTERILYPTSSPSDYYFKISGPAEAKNLEVEIFSLNQSLKPTVTRSSIMAPGNAEAVFTVGAVNETSWRNGPIEPFSSRGPTSDGRLKPDIAGIDGIELYTYMDFLGTSAAAPAVAGAAALILSRSPDLSSKQVKRTLEKNAKDLGSKGPDYTYGDGRMRLIFNSPSVNRYIKEENINPGEKLTVELKAKMPLTLQGGLTVEESVPEPLEIIKLIEPGNQQVGSNGELEVNWPLVKPGTTKELKYRVKVPEGLPSGEYDISGRVNGESIETTTISVSKKGNSPTNEPEPPVLKRTNALFDSFSSAVQFRAIGENLNEVRVRVYSLTGREVFDSDWRSGNTFQWNLQNDSGESVPNGTYLYYVEVRSPNGQTEKSELDKTLVLR